MQIGLLLAILGTAFLSVSRFGLPLGHLPGDFTYKGSDYSVHVPMGTAMLLSVFLTAAMYLISQIRR